jgi:hypothetical protein
MSIKWPYVNWAIADISVSLRCVLREKLPQFNHCQFSDQENDGVTFHWIISSLLPTSQLLDVVIPVVKKCFTLKLFALFFLKATPPPPPKQEWQRLFLFFLFGLLSMYHWNWFSLLSSVFLVPIFYINIAMCNEHSPFPPSLFIYVSKKPPH